MSIRCVASPVNFMMKLTPDNKGADFGLSQFGQVALRIHDVDGAIAFYRDTLGMKFLFSTGTMAFFDCGGVRLMLSMPKGLNSTGQGQFSTSRSTTSRPPGRR